MSEPKIFISILNYNSYQETIECLKSVLNLEYENFSIVLVDNASKDESVKQISQFLEENRLDYDCMDAHKLQLGNKKIVFIRSDENRGYAAGNNIALRFAALQGYDYFWILNNDTVVDQKALQHFVHCARSSQKNVGIWGNVLYYYNSSKLQGIGGKYNKFIAQSRGVGFGQKDHKRICLHKNKVDFPIGASLFFKREFIEEVGMLNETYFLFFEEMDIVQRAKNMGWNFDICCKVIVWHKESASTKKVSDLSDIVRLKNRIRFTKNYFPCYLPWVILSFIPVLINRLRRGKWNIVRELFR